ncbi:MAG: biosynthetic-type acetolactate synthase large subunit [Armatimonadetes bacterium]|nr:biosynthetic-type acetolactate synthase large subunit [Armatimonadota bacterium]
MASETIKGAEALLRVLEEEGVDTIFGYPGGAVIPIYDALYDNPRIRHILTRHEQGAAHAADGYARATGKVGVCMATSGPGAMNLVTGLATAYMDSIPIVAIAGQVRTSAVGKDSFQEADTTGVTMPITKHNYLVTDPAALPDVVREAFHIARTNRPGPVLIDVPADVSGGQTKWTERDEEKLRRRYAPPPDPDPQLIHRAAEMINSAERPLLFIGGGVIASGAHEEVRQLAETANLCVVHTLLGKGGFPETHELSMGMVGMHGHAYANYAMDRCSLLIGIGVRFDDRVTGDLSKFARHAKIIHIDIDPAEIGKVVVPHLGIAGDAKKVLRALLPLVKPRPRTAWEEQLFRWRHEHPLKYEQRDDVVAPQYVVEELYRLTGGSAIVATEVGQNQMWAAQYYKCTRPRQFLTSGGLGTMGYGFPAAIGAQIGRPGETVIDIAGDGSIQMNIQEMATARANGLPVKIVILNNCYLGMVRQWQQLFYNRRYSQVALCAYPNFVKLAEAYDCVGIEVRKPEQVTAALERMLEVNDRPCIVDVKVAPEENVLPFIPAGRSVEEMILNLPA